MQAHRAKLLAKIPPVLRKIIHRCWVMLAVFLVIIAIVFTLFRALTPWVKQYKSQIETQLSTWIGQPVAIEDIETSWYWFVPVLRMDHVTILNHQQQRLDLKQVMVGVNLFSSLWHWQVKPGLLYVEDVYLQIQQHHDHWGIQGIDASRSAQDTSQQTMFAMLATLLVQDKIVIKHVSADIGLDNGMKIPVQNLNLKVVKHANQYRIYGNTILNQEPGTSLTMVARIDAHAENLSKVSGQLYVAVKQADVMQWKAFIPKSSYQLTQGHADMELWLDFKRGQLTQAQSLLELSQISGIEPGWAKPLTIPSLQANILWKRLSTGWKVSADHIKIHMDGVDWPENQMMISYHSTDASYRAYLKTLSIDQVMHVDMSWPQSMQRWLDFKPTGTLQDIQLAWQEGCINYFLTRFSALGWQAKEDVPALTQLFGALYWQPTEGRLELDGEHTKMTPLHHLPPITFDVFNAAFDWKELSHGLRVSMDRLVISHPHLVLSATGAIDNPMTPDANLRLGVDFAAKSAQYWLPYLPSEGLKPKLESWLKKDITRIDHLSGHMATSGLLLAFPFDEGEGVFSIDAHVSGLDLLVNSKWPMNKDIDADLRVNHRTFTADVDQAQLEDVIVHDVNLSVPGIGLGKEVFLLHGNVEATGAQIKSYIFHSPLKKPLARWRGLDIDGLLGLDLQIEVPLYPESDQVLARGQLHFEDNHVAIKAIDTPAEFENVTGHLQFNEYGLTDGGLEGMLSAYPFSIHVQPLIGPTAGTELRFEGELTIDYLQRLLHLPILTFMKGQLIVTGLWTVFPNESDLDTLYINSSLAGVAIHLPQPFGKSMLDIAPLTANMAFHAKNNIDLRLNYGQAMKSIIAIHQNSKHQWIETGDIHFGPGRIDHPSTTGLRITGSFSDVDTEEWRNLILNWPKETSSVSFFENIHDVDILMNPMIFMNQPYPDFRFKAHQEGSKIWSGRLDQKNISGAFQYDVAKNSMAAQMDHVFVDPAVKKAKQTNPSTWDLHPNSLPSLDLALNTLRYHGVDIGKLTLKTTSQLGHWLLDDFSLTTSDYQLAITGDWLENNQGNQSSVKGQLRLNQLSKSLERWSITPAVDAHFGQADFEGHWNAAFYNFSLSQLLGQMHLVFKDGRISHLDRETEEKLGLGKLLSVLSLQTIPRRLKLDFSDLSQKGYSFDIFKGNFQINQGVMTTDDSYIDGPVAYARMEGDLDLVHHLYDIDLRISPYIGASLPLVATIAGSVAGPVAPVAGVATWVALKIINQSMQKINSYTYKISGPWLNPVIQQVSIVKVKK